MPLAAMLLAAGCSKEPVTPDGQKPNPDDKPDVPAVVTFTAQATNILENGVSISISHDGTENDTYYGFYTTDLTSEAGTLIEAQVAELKENVSDLTQVLWKGKTLVRPVMNLTPATDYKYIVFGIKADGTVYGKEGVAEFTTLEPQTIQFEVNQNWTPKYDGKQVHSSYGLVDYVSVASTDTENGYIIDVISTEDIESAGLEEAFLASVDYIQGLIDEDINAGYESSWDDYLSTEAVTEYYNLRDGVNYRVYAIGVTSDGELSGKYAQSEEFTPDPTPETSEGYKKWMGYWIMTDQNDAQYPMIIDTFVPDDTFSLTLVSGFPGARASYNEDGTMTIHTATLLSQINLGSGIGDVVFRGIDTRDYVIGGRDYNLCKLTLDESGTTAQGDPTPVVITLSDNTETTIVSMSYFAVIGESVYGYNNVPTYALPIKSLTWVDPSTLGSVRAKSHAVAAAKRHRTSFKSLDVTTAELLNAVSAR